MASWSVDWSANWSVSHWAATVCPVVWCSYNHRSVFTTQFTYLFDFCLFVFCCCFGGFWGVCFLLGFFVVVFLGGGGLLEGICGLFIFQ